MPQDKRYEFPFGLLWKVKWGLLDRQPVWAAKRAEMVAATKVDVSAAS